MLVAAQMGNPLNAIFIDGKPIAACLQLRPGMIISVVPRTPTERSEDSKQNALGAFKDDPEFDAMIQRVNAEREAEKDRS